MNISADGKHAPAGAKSAYAIADYCESRDNNFNLIRITAATLVILTHAFGIAGSAALEPLKSTFGISLGSWSVNVFFVSSGFLILKSWDKWKSVTRFIWARFVRIYPALWVCVLICIFGVGLIFTTLPTYEYLVHTDTLKFAIKNMTLVKGTYTYLPGTFQSHEGGTNLSLWTLPYELRMYFAVLVLGWTGWLYKRALVPLLLIAAFCLHAWSVVNHSADEVWADYARFTFFFFAGGYIYLRRQAIPVSAPVSFTLVCALSGSLLIPEVWIRTVLLSLATPYLVIYCAYVPINFLHKYNKLGDYSYGIYIYGAPVQHIVLAVSGGLLSVAGNFFWTASISLIIATMSWHFLESKALKWAIPKSFAAIGRTSPR